MGTIKELLAIKPEADIKLPKKFKANWMAALKSEEYAQAEGNLAKENVGFCCLGVAAQVCEVGVNKLLGIGILSDMDYKAKNRLPQVFFTEDGEKLQDQFAKFNDIDKYTFPQIAKWINKYL